MMNHSTRVMRRPRRTHHRLAIAGIITVICHAFLTRTMSAVNPQHGKSVGLHHSETPRHGGVFAALLATIMLLAAACSGSPGNHVAQHGSTATQRSTSTQRSGALAFSGCMRSNGVPNYPDPTSSGGIPKETAQQLGVSSSLLQAAGRACQHLLTSGGGMTQAYVQHLIARELRVSRCMRAHGVTGFPDPGSDGHFPDGPLHRAENTPEYQAAQSGCWALGAP
jgi:hypothetical protein